MKPTYEDNHITLYGKSCLDMAEIEDETVQMVVTSPPYWGLRKYSGDQDLIWGGDPECEHQWQAAHKKVGRNDTEEMYSHAGKLAMSDTETSTCQLCGAWRGGYGLEPTPEMYVDHTVEILREIWRVLRKDGVVFWNIGDSYATPKVGNTQSSIIGKHELLNAMKIEKKLPPGMKPKDLCLIPFRVAIAAQEDGWWVRSDIIWSKPNPMPESVTDRPTNSHEYILMLTKSAKYYWDQEAVREKGVYPDGETRARGDNHKSLESGSRTTAGLHTKDWIGNGGRNLRSVWEFPTQPYPDAHFAVFPEKLPELCIKAATPEVGCCSKCGAPWTRVMEKGSADHGADTESQYEKGTSAYRLAKLRQSARAQGDEYANETKTIGWKPQCKCDAEKVPSIILDPFAGAGTSLWVAKKLNRKAVGYELSSEYCDLIIKRNSQQVMT